MATKTIKLSERELEILVFHFNADISFGVNGSFGDGDDWLHNEKTLKYGNSMAHFEKAEGILIKLKKSLYGEKRTVETQKGL